MIARWPLPLYGLEAEVGAVVAEELDVGVSGLDRVADRALREVARIDHGRGGGRSASSSRRSPAQRCGSRSSRPRRCDARSERAFPERRSPSSVNGFGARPSRRAGRDLDRVDLREVGLAGRCSPTGSRGRAGEGRVRRREDRRVVDLREAADGVHVDEDARRRPRGAHERERAVGLPLVHRARAVVDVGRARVIVRVAAVGDDLGAADDQLARVVALVAADLAPARRCRRSRRA